MKRAKICLTLCVLAFAVNLSAATRFRAASPADPVIGRYEIVFSDTVLDAEAAATELARTYAARLEPFAGDSVAGAVMTMLPERARLMSSDPRVAMVTEIGTPAGVLAGVSAPPRPGAAESMARPTTPRPHADDAWSSGAYLYDAAGNIKSIGSDTYAYDTALRVVAATTENQRSAVSRSQKYAYDSFGNRVSSTTAHSDASRCVNGTLCEENVGVDKRTNRINTNGAEYDAAGNLTRIDAAYSYAYDAVGMLFRQQTPGVTQFVYTAADERIAVYTAGRWEWSLRDHAGKVLRTFTSNDHGNERGTAGFTWTKDYVYRGSLLLASDAPSGRRHYHLDHLGTPRVITDDGGRKLGTHAYHAFGAEVPLSFLEHPQERLKFTGHERDLSPDIHTLDYMHARYYSATLGRFQSVDPAGFDLSRPQSFNRYAYVGNNPINRIDPDGREDVELTCAPPQPCTRAKWDKAKVAADNATNEQYVRAAEEGKLEVRRGRVRPTTRQMAKAAGGPAPKGMHLGHKQALVLNGPALDPSNIAVEAASTNMSHGARIRNAIKGLADGTRIIKWNYTVLSFGGVLSSISQARSYATFMANQEAVHPGFVNTNDMMRWVFTGDTTATPPTAFDIPDT